MVPNVENEFVQDAEVPATEGRRQFKSHTIGVIAGAIGRHSVEIASLIKGEACLRRRSVYVHIEVV
jgi:hypothetical protein